MDLQEASTKELLLLLICEDPHLIWEWVVPTWVATTWVATTWVVLLPIWVLDLLMVAGDLVMAISTISCFRATPTSSSSLKLGENLVAAVDPACLLLA